MSDLTLGMTAEVRLTAFEQRTTPLVQGRLEYVSADALSDPGRNSLPTIWPGWRWTSSPSRMPASAPAGGHAGGSLPAGAQPYGHRCLLDPVTQSLGRAFRER